LGAHLAYLTGVILPVKVLGDLLPLLPIIATLKTARLGPRVDGILGGDAILPNRTARLAAPKLAAVDLALGCGEESPFSRGALPVPAICTALIDISILSGVKVASATRALADILQELRTARRFPGAQGVLRSRIGIQGEGVRRREEGCAPGGAPEPAIERRVTVLKIR
jgi:hypothetical protein